MYHPTALNIGCGKPFFRFLFKFQFQKVEMMKAEKVLLFAAFAMVLGANAYAFDLQAGTSWLAGRNYSSEFVGGTGYALMALKAQNSNGDVQNSIAAILNADLANNDSWSWAEADLPSIETWALSESSLQQGNANAITQRLLTLKGNYGGFKGLFECVAQCSNPDWTQQQWEPVETATDSSLALIALKKLGTLDDQTKNAAINFIYSLQNTDGSFNQTPSEKETQLYSLGPDIISTTSLAVMALEENGAGSDSHTQNAIQFLKQQARNCFGDYGKIYGPSLASRAFAEAGLGDFSSSAAEYAVLAQKQDGGFADALRSSQNSNSIDTGAAVAAAKNIAGKGACAPLAASLSFNSQIIAGNNQHFTATVEGAINNAALTITMPNGNTATQQLSKVNDTLYQADFQQTQTAGAYAVLLQLTPRHGSALTQSFAFQVSNTAPPTPTGTPTPTAQPATIIIQAPPQQEVRFVVATPSAQTQGEIDDRLNLMQAKLDRAEIELNNALQNRQELQTPSQSNGQTSAVTGLAASNPIVSLSVQGNSVALEANPIVFILLAVLIVVFTLYRRWSSLRAKVGK